ncbi:hypothetical protein SUDANB105_04172 [Streptomyces sp. enrichment culture]
MCATGGGQARTWVLMWAIALWIHGLWAARGPERSLG